MDCAHGCDKTDPDSDLYQDLDLIALGYVLNVNEFGLLCSRVVSDELMRQLFPFYYSIGPTQMSTQSIAGVYAKSMHIYVTVYILNLEPRYNLSISVKLILLRNIFTLSTM